MIGLRQRFADTLFSGMSSVQPPTRHVNAVRDASLQVRVVRQVPLHYSKGADATIDRSAHVRAASGLDWVGDKLAVVQDDSNFIALVDVISGVAEFISLPAGALGKRMFDDERGNKADKFDFESLLATTLSDGTDVLLAFGSGSTSRRESVAIVPLKDEGEPRVLPAHALYDVLRACHSFAGSELNIEGALRVGSRLRLFGRGNGAVSEGVERVNATCDLDWADFLRYLENPATIAAPALLNVVRFQLGEMSGTRITFTDAAVVPGGSGYADGSVLYTGTAESSNDVVDDGPVAGSVVGIISADMGGTARFAEIRDAAGEVIRAKVEGIAVGDFARGQIFVVVDADDHNRPSELWELEWKDPAHAEMQKFRSDSRAICTPMYGTSLPAHEPEQQCESCSAMGTTGRLTKFESDGRVREMHRFCTDCWPEQRARYYARWKEQERVVRDAWERARHDRDDWTTQPPKTGSTEEACATWHFHLQMLADLRKIQRHQHYGESGPDSPDHDVMMADFAQILKEAIPTTLGEMPWELEQIILSHGNYPREATTELPFHLRREAHIAAAQGDMTKAKHQADTLLALMDDYLQGDGLPGQAPE